MNLLRPVAIPDGKYRGVWSGHQLKLRYRGKDVYVETNLGVRGMNVPVVFRVSGNRVNEQSIEVQEVGGH